MQRHSIIAFSILLGLGAVVAAVAAPTSSSRRPGSRSAGVSEARPDRGSRPAIALARPNFVSRCPYSHRNTDDAIVFPRAPGAAHDHTYIGNETTNAYSTLSSLLNGATTCERPGDTAAYWAPTLLDPTGHPVVPRNATVYYRRPTDGTIKPFPPGFRMIAGDSHATTPQPVTVVYWDCGPYSSVARQTTIPKCPDAKLHGLAFHVGFPACWDGTNLDSPDHHGHIVYAKRLGCPSDHHVPLPAIELNLRYPTTGGKGFTLSSGGQLTGHADFFNAWNQGVLASLVDGCLNAMRHCSTGS